ncbi:MAG: YegP family protein [Clostridia bacterium]|nr:YegP family protein [Clostridia bacterium]
MAELKGIFYYGETKNGHFNFHLKAPNRETIGVCEGAYADLSSCKRGIASVQKFAPIVVDKIEDLTLKKPMEALKFPKAEVYQDKQGKFRFRIYANNGNLVCISESGYASKESAKAGIASVAKWAPTADVMSEKDYIEATKKK